MITILSRSSSHRKVTAAGGGGGGYSALILSEPSLRSYKRLGDAFGSGTIVDAYDSALNGTPHGGVTLGVAGALAGDSDTAAQFDGVDDYISAPLTSFGTSHYDGSIAIEWWQYRATADLGVNQGFAIATAFYGEGRIQSHTPYTDKNLYFDAAGSRVSADYTAYLDALTHIILVGDVDAGNQKIYLNGSLVTTGGSFSGAGDEIVAMVIGRGTDGYQKGKQDEFAIYASKLSSTIAAAHYAAGI